jgi:hypothetical protein
MNPSEKKWRDETRRMWAKHNHAGKMEPKLTLIAKEVA